MGFLAEVIPPACWIILHLQNLDLSSTVNEGGPELPCMTGNYNYYLLLYITSIVRQL